MKRENIYCETGGDLRSFLSSPRRFAAISLWAGVALIAILDILLSGRDNTDFSAVAGGCCCSAISCHRICDAGSWYGLDQDVCCGAGY